MPRHFTLARYTKACLLLSDDNSMAGSGSLTQQAQARTRVMGGAKGDGGDRQTESIGSQGRGIWRAGVITMKCYSRPFLLAVLPSRHVTARAAQLS
jgi:hypothetical protein